MALILATTTEEHFFPVSGKNRNPKEGQTEFKKSPLLIQVRPQGRSALGGKAFLRMRTFCTIPFYSIHNMGEKKKKKKQYLFKEEIIFQRLSSKQLDGGAQAGEMGIYTGVAGPVSSRAAIALYTLRYSLITSLKKQTAGATLRRMFLSNAPS